MKGSIGRGAIAVLCLLQFVPGCTTRRSTKTLTGMEGQVELTVPTGWKVETDLNEAADIQVSHRASEMYVIVLSENKADLNDMTLERHSKITLDALTEKLDSPQVQGPKSLTISGSKALQYEIRGARELTKIIYIHTTVESPNFFTQILAWTLPSRYEKNIPTLEKVVEQFREVGATSTTARPAE